jgi:hypothetical protein
MKTPVTLIAMPVLALWLGGCNDNDHVSWKDVTSDLTPEMHGVAERDEDNHNAFSVAQNQNIRMISDDLDRVFLLDHPSRLSPFPITFTSGQPR